MERDLERPRQKVGQREGGAGKRRKKEKKKQKEAGGKRELKLKRAVQSLGNEESDPAGAGMGLLIQAPTSPKSGPLPLLPIVRSAEPPPG